MYSYSCLYRLVLGGKTLHQSAGLEILGRLSSNFYGQTFYGVLVLGFTGASLVPGSSQEFGAMGNDLGAELEAESARVSLVTRLCLHSVFTGPWIFRGSWSPTWILEL